MSVIRSIVPTIHAFPPRLMRSLVRLGALTLFLAAAACGSTDADKTIPDQPAETLFNRGMSQLEQGNGGEAVKMFDEVDRQHPYSVWANKAQLMSAFSYY